MFLTVAQAAQQGPHQVSSVGFLAVVGVGLYFLSKRGGGGGGYGGRSG